MFSAHFQVFYPKLFFSIHSNYTFSYSLGYILKTFQLHQVDKTYNFHAIEAQRLPCIIGETPK